MNLKQLVTFYNNNVFEGEEYDLTFVNRDILEVLVRNGFEVQELYSFDYRDGEKEVDIYLPVTLINDSYCTYTTVQANIDKVADWNDHLDMWDGEVSETNFIINIKD